MTKAKAGLKYILPRNTAEKYHCKENWTEQSGKEAELKFESGRKKTTEMPLCQKKSKSETECRKMTTDREQKWPRY